MAMGQITRTAVRATAVDFSYPYFVAMMGIVSKKPFPLPKYMAILWPFETDVWVFLICTLAASGLLDWTFSKLRSRGRREKVSFGMAYFHAYQILFMQSKLVNVVFNTTSHCDRLQALPTGQSCGTDVVF